MRCVAETLPDVPTVRTECNGRFWEGRFKLQILLDEASLLACARATFDLNPIRAANRRNPETSDYTGAKDRIDDS